jgi:hypothetical protein
LPKRHQGCGEKDGKKNCELTLWPMISTHEPSHGRLSSAGVTAGFSALRPLEKIGAATGTVRHYVL